MFSMLEDSGWALVTEEQAAQEEIPTLFDDDLPSIGVYK